MTAYYNEIDPYAAQWLRRAQGVRERLRMGWEVVSLAMALAGGGAGVSRMEAEELLDAFCERVERERERVFPETEKRRVG